MVGPFYAGSKRILTVKPGDGTAASVRIRLVSPSGTVTTWPCSYNVTTAQWESDDEFYANETGWWSRVDEFFAAGDASKPGDSRNVPFQVYPTMHSIPS